MKAAIIITAFMTLGACLRGQETASVPTVEAKGAYVRTWVMISAEAPGKPVGTMPPLKDKLRLIYTDTEGNDAALVSNPYPYMTTGYNEFPVGPHAVRLTRVLGTTSEQLTQAELKPKAGAFLTIVILQENGRYRLEVIDNTPPPPKPDPNSPGKIEPPPKEIVFYNFLPDTSFTVTCSDPQFAKVASYDRPDKVSGLPAKACSLSTVIPYGKRKNVSTIEADLQTNDSLSYVMMRDMYNRTVPAIIPNAKLD